MAWRGARRTLLWLWPIISVGDLSNAWFKIKPAFLFLEKKKKKKKNAPFHGDPSLSRFFSIFHPQSNFHSGLPVDK